MQNLHRIIARLSTTTPNRITSKLVSHRFQSVQAGCDGGGEEGEKEWEKTVATSFGGPATDIFVGNMCLTWLTMEHFDGEVVGHRTGATKSGGEKPSQSSVVSSLQEIDDCIKELEAENRKSKAFKDGWGERMREMSVLLKSVKEPGAQSSYLKDSEKAEMYRLHKENPEVYNVERLARDYRIMRQRVHAILWLKELEEEEEKKLGHPLDDSVELLLDNFPEFSIPMTGNSMWHLFLISQILKLCLRVGMALPKIWLRSIIRFQRRRMRCFIRNLSRE